MLRTNSHNANRLPHLRLAKMLCVAIAMFSLQAFAANQTLTAGIEPGFPPFSYQQQGTAKGIAPDIMRAVAKDQGLNIKFVALPFPSLIPALAAGKLQIIADGLSVTAQRAKRIDYTLPWIESNDVIVAPKKSKKNVFTAVCCGAKLGIQGGSSQEGWVNTHLKNSGMKINLKDYSNYVTIVTDMLSGRVDAADLPETTALQFINKGQPIKILGKIYIHNPVAFAVKKGDPHKLLAKLNKGLVDVYKSGELAKIVHKYIPGLPVPSVPPANLPNWVNTYKAPIPGIGNQ